MPISNNVKSLEDIGKKPNRGVSWSGQEKILHEDVYNPMLDTTRRLPKRKDKSFNGAVQ